MNLNDELIALLGNSGADYNSINYQSADAAPNAPLITQPQTYNDMPQADPALVESFMRLLQGSGLAGANYSPPVSPNTIISTGKPFVDTGVSNDPMDQPMDNDPAFLKAMANFDANAHLLNRSEAAPGNDMQTRVDAINREHNKNGISASVDSNGRAFFTNVDSDGNRLPGNPPLVGSDAANVAGSVRGILTQLRSTTDAKTAAALQDQLNQAAAAETTTLQLEALKHAEIKMGVPQLEKDLNNSLMVDRASPNWFPGAGDSQNTARIRQTLGQAHSQADIEVERSLRSNITANGLSAALKSAQTEVARITRLSDRKDALSDAAANRALAKEDMHQAALEEQATAMLQSTKDNIRILNPVLANAPDTELVTNYNKAKAVPAYDIAIKTPDNELPRLAASGNAYASTLIRSKEAALGFTQAETDSKIASLRDIMNNDKTLQKAYRDSLPNSAERDKQVKALFGEIGAKAAGTKEDKAMVSAQKYQLAKLALSSIATDRFAGNVEEWKSLDPDLNMAIEKVKKLQLKPNIKEITVAYIGDYTGRDATLRVESLIKLMEQAASKYDGSALGSPNTMAIKNEITALRLGGLLKAIDPYIPSGQRMWDNFSQKKLRDAAGNLILGESLNGQ